MQSVGKAFAILRGRLTGDKDEAYDFINSMDPAVMRARNRAESKLRKKAKKNYKMGRPVRYR